VFCLSRRVTFGGHREGAPYGAPSHYAASLLARRFRLTGLQRASALAAARASNGTANLVGAALGVGRVQAARRNTGAVGVADLPREARALGAIGRATAEDRVLTLPRGLTRRNHAVLPAGTAPLRVGRARAARHTGGARVTELPRQARALLGVIGRSTADAAADA